MSASGIKSIPQSRLRHLTEDELFLLKAKAAAQLELRRRTEERAAGVPAGWEERIHTLFPTYTTAPFAERHQELWEWVESINDEPVDPFIAIWPRGGGKSTTAEMVVVDLGARGKRKYCWYVCGTQEQADKHVSTIGAMLVNQAVTNFFPSMAEPRVGKNGTRSWNRTVVRVSTGFAIEAVGLDKQIRGGKIEEARPDLIILDDIDDTEDSPLTIRKKEKAITQKILPSGANNVAVLFVQNLIHNQSIASKLANLGLSGARWLADRYVSGPHPAIEDFQYILVPTETGALKAVITSGEATWEGQDLDVCQHQINTWGIRSFITESQHDVDEEHPEALWSRDILSTTRVWDHPPLTNVVIAVDPPGTVNGQCGIIAGGKARVGKLSHGYVLGDYSTSHGAKTSNWAKAILKAYITHQADEIIVEGNHGAAAVEEVIRLTELPDYNTGEILVKGEFLKITIVNASRGKRVRAEPVAVVYEEGRGHMVGEFPMLEKELTTWLPGDDSPNRLDALVWMFVGLKLINERKPPAGTVIEQKHDTYKSQYDSGRRKIFR